MKDNMEVLENVPHRCFSIIFISIIVSVIHIIVTIIHIIVTIMKTLWFSL